MTSHMDFGPGMHGQPKVMNVVVYLTKQVLSYR